MTCLQRRDSILSVAKGGKPCLGRDLVLRMKSGGGGCEPQRRLGDARLWTVSPASRRKYTAHAGVLQENVLTFDPFKERDVSGGSQTKPIEQKTSAGG